MDKPPFRWVERSDKDKPTAKRHIRMQRLHVRGYRTMGVWLEYFPRLHVWRLRQVIGAEHSNPSKFQRTHTLLEFPDTQPLEEIQQLCETTLTLNPELLR